jgi:hypothetical protein
MADLQIQLDIVKILQQIAVDSCKRSDILASVNRKGDDPTMKKSYLRMTHR